MAEMVADWSASFEAFLGRFAGRFPRVESRRRMRWYVKGLLAEIERKNGWTLAEAAGDAGPEGMQRLLNFYAWDADGLRDDVRAAVVERIGDGEQGVLIVDETGFLKKGAHSAGVARQYSGTAGRIENSQIGVFLAYASPRGRALIDRELYLPKDWTDDRDRCRAAGIDDEVEFATKQVLARRMIERALATEVPFGWVTADELYGQDTKFRLWLETVDVPHVVAVPKSAMVVSMHLAKVRVARMIADVADADWQRLSCGDGVRGPRVSDWTAVEIRPLRRRGWGHWLLARRSVSDPTDIAYYVCFGPADTSLAELVRVAGSRWAIEECFQTAKNETGLDHYQARGYQAWYRHVTLSMTALAFLVITRPTVEKGAPLLAMVRP
ncbi:SRSO17 transposase [Kutzneria kofuensis]|uniref:SRSO17 transposase n=1 Tax=Kutzneria kofuensis TaxID=103725 RepID=A0A7W9KJY8_9PSEU|nr:IS701 family transposase [Kutzneria kofuensis]MBB5891420.1 SRSO17 transposase [Kutzneria kofuensis]MBB5891427.1 SRSO17 transposase [Kutzneria kofuensis]MBB5893815.1 SRSO17 transposase [Kutzneria kofuensis]